MSWTKRFMWSFWIFVVTMLLWQFYVYNDKISQPLAHPKQDHYFFYMHTGTTTAAATTDHAGPFVEQTAFRVEDNTPSSSSFTCHVTLKNSGKAKAVNVQVCVRPFRGALPQDVDDGGRNSNKPLSDDDPRAQTNQWVPFPDLDPGETSTQSVVFMKDNSALEFGNNPRAEIIYEPEKK